MFTNILIPTDGSELSLDAGQKAINLAKTFKATVTVLMVSRTHKQLRDEGFVVPGLDMGKAAWEKGVTERADKVLNAIAAQAKSAGVKCETVHVFKDWTYVAIIDVAKKKGCDLIVMGSHGHGGLKQLMLGSETARVLSHSKIPVLVYR
jgi:nucleotide-binding universal stress UspA family protein